MPDKFQNKYRIPSARLQGYDYGKNGAYFITICTKNRIHYFGEIKPPSGNVETHYYASGLETQNIASGNETQNVASGNETQNIASGNETQNVASLQMTTIGVIANEYWQKIPDHFPFVILDEFVIMPNHVHGIIIISKLADVESSSETQNIASLQEIKFANKFGPQSGNISSVIRGYKASVQSFATTNKIEFAWQTRFYDRIIRDDDEMKRVRKYIVQNPDNWPLDRNNKEGLYM